MPVPPTSLRASRYGSACQPFRVKRETGWHAEPYCGRAAAPKRLGSEGGPGVAELTVASMVAPLRGRPVAEIIPEFLPDSATAGERRVFALLQRLPDDAIVYYEPIVRRRWPDFIVILPSVGVVVVEVKSIPLSWITSVDLHHLHYMQSGNQQMQPHPARQANGYMRRLMQACHEHPRGSELKRGGHFAVAFGYLTILTGISRPELQQSPWANFFPQHASLCSDEFEDAALNADALVTAFRNAIDPELPRLTISPDRVSLLRAIISPPARLPRAPSVREDETPFVSLDILDLEQEKAARSIGSGHRILYGVPGSGKTVILIAVARMLADAGKSVLVLCYNKFLRDYLWRTLSDYPTINVTRFGVWAMSQGASQSPDADAFGNGLFAIIGTGGGEAGKYDAVLIDEGQDFWPSWFKCAVQALSDPTHGTLIVAYDLSQNLYGVALPKWSSVGIRAIGRTRRFLRNYRNTKEIVGAAYSFGHRDGETDEDKPQPSVLTPENCARSGSRPAILQLPNRDAQTNACIRIVRDLSQGGLSIDGRTETAQQQEIMVLCKTRAEAERMSGEMKRAGLAATVSTIHGARGLQAKAVILFAADELHPEHDRSLMYVALTRPTDVLIALWSHETPLTKELLSNVERARSEGAV